MPKKLSNKDIIERMLLHGFGNTVTARAVLSTVTMCLLDVFDEIQNSGDSVEVSDFGTFTFEYEKRSGRNCMADKPRLARIVFSPKRSLAEIMETRFPALTHSDFLPSDRRPTPGQLRARELFATAGKRQRDRIQKEASIEREKTSKE
jgi:nucleoid DNA-binding protein